MLVAVGICAPYRTQPRRAVCGDGCVGL